MADAILADWEQSVTKFVKVMPIDYKRVLKERKTHDEEQEAEMHDEAMSR